MASFLDELSAGLKTVPQNLNLEGTAAGFGRLGTVIGQGFSENRGTIGDLLQTAGRAISPIVYQQWKQAQQRQRELVIQGTINAIENGSIDPVKGTAVLQKMGIQMPDGAGFGPGPGAREQLRRVEEQKRLEGDLTAADEFAATEIARRFSEKNMGKMDKSGGNVAAPTDITASPEYHSLRAEYLYGKGRRQEADAATDRYLKLVEEQRKINAPAGGSGTEAERALGVLRQLQQKFDSGSKLTRDEILQAQSARALLSRQQMSIDPFTGKPYMERPLTIPPSLSVGAVGGNAGVPSVAGPAVSGSTQPRAASPGVPVNQLPSMEGGRKPIDADTEKKLVSSASVLSQAQTLLNSFKPEFSGFVSDALAGAAIESGRRLGGPYQQTAEFWQQYEQWATDMRAEKFGLSLTGNEKAQFDKYRAKPSDKPEVARTNMERQLKIVNAAIDRQMTALGKAGYNVEQAKALVGDSPQQSAPTVRESNSIPDASTVKPGTIVKDAKTGKPLYRSNGKTWERM